MSLSSSPGGQPTLFDYSERSELRLTALGSAVTSDLPILGSADECEVRPLFHLSRSGSSATHSATPPSDSQSLNRDVETPESSIWDAEERNSKLASDLSEEIDAHIEDTERQTQCGGSTGSLADLMIAEIAAEIEALGSDNGGPEVREQKTQCGGMTGSLANLMIAEIAAEIDALGSKTGEGEVQDVPDVAEIGYEIEASEPTMSDAKARIQLFEESSEYFFYARDRTFHDQFSRRHPHLPLVRAEGRMKAFEGTEAWSRYLKALQVVVVGHETMPELQSGATRQAGDTEIRESAAVDDGIKRAGGNSGKSKERVQGQLSKQWRDLGVEKRPMSRVSSSDAW